jgi:hypothetical protein
MNIADSSNSYDYRLAKARSTFGAAKLTLLEFKKPIEILEHIVTTDPELFVDAPEPAVEEPKPEEKKSKGHKKEKEPKKGKEPPAPEVVEEPAAETEPELTLDDAIRELLGSDAPGQEATAVVPMADDPNLPPLDAWEGLSAEDRRSLREHIDANPTAKSELEIAFGYFKEALQVSFEAAENIAQLQQSHNPGLLRQLTQEGDGLLGKLKGKLFYVTRLPELMVEFPRIAEMLPEPDPNKPKSQTAPLSGTKPLATPKDEPTSPEV